MNNERTSKELAGIVRDDFLWLEGVAGAPHGQAVLAALDELVRRADESERESRRASWLKSDLLDVIAENDSLRERIKALEAVTEQAHIVARIYGETLCQGNEGREFMDAVDALFPKEADE